MHWLYFGIIATSLHRLSKAPHLTSIASSLIITSSSIPPCFTAILLVCIYLVFLVGPCSSPIQISSSIKNLLSVWLSQYSFSSLTAQNLSRSTSLMWFLAQAGSFSIFRSISCFDSFQKMKDLSKWIIGIIILFFLLNNSGIIDLGLFSSFSEPIKHLDVEPIKHYI